MYNAIGAHIYAGGFTVGVREHFNVLGHLEHAAYGEEVVRMNYPEIPVISGGPENWKPFIEKLPKGRNRPRFIFANPPCAIWSGASAGRITQWHEDPRLTFHHDIFALLPEMEPDVMVIESVPPIFTKGRAHVDDLIVRAKTIGYSTTVVKHNAMWMGVAQKRGRIFLAFHRVKIDWTPPAFDKVVTVRQAIKGLPKRTKGYDPMITSEKLLRLLEHTPPGGRVRNTFDQMNPEEERNHRGQVIGRPSFLNTRFPLDKVGPIVLAGKSIHPTEPRFMTQEELAAICSFPSDYKWPAKNFGDISGFMSRGVMPRVGSWVAENVARAIEAGKRSNEQTASVYDVTGPPGREYELPVPNPVTYHDMKTSSDVETELPWSTPRFDVAAQVHTLGADSLLPPNYRPSKVHPKALVTGSTPMQVGSDRTKLKIITAASAWKGVLEDLGYEVEWRAVTPGENVSHYDVVISNLNKPSSIASNYVYGALWALMKRPDAIIAIDDWQIHETLSGIQVFARSRERAFSFRGGDIPEEYKTILHDGLIELAKGDWRWPIIIPVLGNGDSRLLKIPAKNVVPIDPTNYVPRYPVIDIKRSKKWVQASLSGKPVPLGLLWPIDEYGPQNREEGGLGPAGLNAKPRLKEAELMNVYLASLGILSPAHPHAGSGWWRVRYLMAADAKCVLSADAREAACLGDPYIEASDPRRVEKMSLSAVADLAARQAACLAEVAWPKSKVRSVMKKLIASRAALRPKIDASTPATVLPIRNPATPKAVVPTRIRPKALLTGSTAMQVGSDRTELKIIPTAAAWPEALKDLGYDVEWRPVVLGEDLSSYSVVISILNAPNKLGATYFYGALYALLRRPDAIIALDDWQIEDIQSGIETFARSRERAFNLRGDVVPEEHRDRLFGGLLELAEGNWRWPVIFPYLGNGDLSLVKATGRVVPIDPTPYAPRYPKSAPPVHRAKQWIHASLHAKTVPTTVWPMVELGPQNRGKGGTGPAGEGAKPRMPETELVDLYARSWGVIAPPHPHAGSGWWSSRFFRAADAGAIVSATEATAKVLGGPYMKASDPRRVERLSGPALRVLAEEQAACLASIAWPKDRTRKALRDLIASRAALAPAGMPETGVATPHRSSWTPPSAPAGVTGRVKPSQPRLSLGEKPVKGSGARIREMLLAGVDANEILVKIHSEFPGSKAGPSDVSWNKQKLRKEDADAAGLPRPL